jgi:hypothetical protein
MASKPPTWQPLMGWGGRLTAQGGIGNPVPGILRQAREQGLFDPMGSQSIMRLLQQRAIATASNRRRRGEVLGNLVGLDPYQQRVAMLDTERAAGGELSDFLGNARLQQLLGGQEWARGLLGSERGFQQNMALARLQAQIAQQMQGGGAGAILGQILGTGGGAALGKWLGPR